MPDKPAGTVIAVEGISEDGEMNYYEQFAVTLEGGTGISGAEKTIDIRLIGGKKGTIWMLNLEDVEAALRFLKAELKRTGRE